MPKSITPADHQADLVASELRYRRLFESAKDGILILDAETGVIIDVNPFLTTLLVSRHEDIVGKQVWDLGFLRDIAPSREKFLELQEQEYVRYDNLPLETSTGAKIDVEFVSNVYPVAGKRIVQCNIRDITERTKTQVELRRYRENLEELVAQRTQQLENAKLEAVTANLAKGRFVSNMSHEIRTPLNAILGFSQLMMRDPSLSVENLEHLETINRSGDYLLTLINEILDFSKLEAGRVTLVPTVFQLPRLFTSLAALFQDQVDTKGLVLTTHLSPELSEFVATDEGKLRQILVNLVGNAVKFTSRGTIDLRARQESVDGAVRLIVEVEDSGVGFSTQDLAKAFRPFEQTLRGTQAGGTGLGLVISRQYAQLLGGDIALASTEGSGSLFTVTVRVVPELSAYRTRPDAGVRVKGLAAGNPGVRVLVVDDEEDNRALLKELLELVGFEVKLASNGLQAVAAFREWNPQLILMDVKMPVLGGEDAIRQIRLIPLGDRVKIIAVTAAAFDEDRVESHNWGADGYLRKPFLERELFDGIQALLGLLYEYEPLSQRA